MNGYPTYKQYTLVLSSSQIVEIFLLGKVLQEFFHNKKGPTKVTTLLRIAQAPVIIRMALLSFNNQQQRTESEAKTVNNGNWLGEPAKIDS